MTYAWHFVSDDYKLRDGSPAAKAGCVERYSGPLVLCQTGLHYSRNPWDALKYAPGAMLRLVDTRGRVHDPAGEDKGVCSERKVIAVMDATELCRYFGRMQAVACLDHWQTDPDGAVLDWLMTGDKAAWSAAWSAARSAAWSAAESAARSAAESAAESAARSAAWSAAWSAAESAARDEFTQLVYECFEDFL